MAVCFTCDPIVVMYGSNAVAKCRNCGQRLILPEERLAEVPVVEEPAPKRRRAKRS